MLPVESEALYRMRKSYRVGVTGLGAVTPVGLDMESTFKALVYPARPLGLRLVGAPPMREGSVLSREEVERIIPHRWPFIFIGGVESIDFGNRAVGWMVNLNHPDINWKAGHFPEHSIVPGVITQEALQQLGALTVLGMHEHRGKMAYLTGVDGMRYRGKIVPGEDIRLEVEVLGLREIAGQIFGKGHVRAINSANTPAVEGNISFVLLNPASKAA